MKKISVWRHSWAVGVFLLTGITSAYAHTASESMDDRGGSGAANPKVQTARAAVFKEHPQLLQSIMRGGGFGSQMSYAVANSMYSRNDAQAIADARAKLTIENVAPRTWLLRFPIVNVIVFETDEGLVLVDSGYAPAGPVLAEVLPQLSNQPVHTIVHTHFHADHAFGAWALMAQGARPRVVAEERFIEQMEIDMRMYGLNARNNQQKLADVPRNWEQAVRPTETFHRKKVLRIGGEDFVLTHARGETEDQLWVAVPGRDIIASADYFQGFLPNAGNGKRRQRYPEEWAVALREMAAQAPQLLLPAHGAAIRGTSEIQQRLRSQAAILDSIAQQVVDGLNRGERKDIVFDRIALPPDLASSPDAQELYVSTRDIARMVASQYTGWWDDIPSHWRPATLASEAAELANLAGGARKLIARALELAPHNSALAAQLADWAWLADERDPKVLQGALQVYGQRVSQPLPTQEALVYAEHMVRLQLRLQDLISTAD